MNVIQSVQTREQIFEWRSDDQPARFWSVAMAKEFINLARDRGISFGQTISFEMVREAAKHNYELPNLLPQNIEAADLSVPIISVELFNPKANRNEAVIIDGWHRISKWLASPELLPDGMKVYHLPAIVSDEIQRLTAEAMNGGMIESGDGYTFVTRIIKPEGGL